MNDCVYTCSSVISVNPCYPIYLFVDRVNELFHVSIQINKGNLIRESIKSDASGKIKINFLSDYISKGVVEVTIKTPSGEVVPIPFGTQCTPFCGVELKVEISQSDNFPNKKCASNNNCTWTTKVNNCTFTQSTKNCTWVLKIMDKVKYNGVEYKISATPTIVVANVLQINPAYVAELNAIEATAFSVTLIGTNVSVTYQGTAIVDFMNGCNEVLKVCV